jgi:hypothetical protein
MPAGRLISPEIPGSGHLFANVRTSRRSSVTCCGPTLPSAGTVAARTKSLSSLLPDSFCTSSASCTARWRKFATVRRSSSRISRDVNAAVPIRMPPGTWADASPDTAFSGEQDRGSKKKRGGEIGGDVLLMVMPRRSPIFSTLDPVSLRGRRSHSTRWLSVPPVCSLYPCLRSSSASACAFLITCCAYAFQDGWLACNKDVAIPAMVLLCGPPWHAGNTASFTRFSRSLWASPSLRKKMRPARGPRSVLCLRGLCSAFVPQKKRQSGHLRRCRHDIAILEGISELLCGNETGCMGDICHEGSPVLIGNFTKRLVIPISGIC